MADAERFFAATGLGRAYKSSHAHFAGLRSDFSHFGKLPLQCLSLSFSFLSLCLFTYGTLSVCTFKFIVHSINGGKGQEFCVFESEMP